MHHSSCGSSLVFAAINGIQANLCMASNKEKATERKRKADAKLQEAAAKKRKDEEEAKVAASFLEPPSAAAPAASSASDEE
eukprot:815659-Rhodomonas_salina.1